MNGFHGEYEATVDAKGRFLLPGGLRKQLPEGESRFILGRGFEKCLTLYPMKSWELIIAKISQLNDFDPKMDTITSYINKTGEQNLNVFIVGIRKFPFYFQLKEKTKMLK